MTPERSSLREDVFNDEALGRLARANRDYLNSHAEYIVPLAEMLLEARGALAVLERRVEGAEELMHAAYDELREVKRRLAQAEAENKLLYAEMARLPNRQAAEAFGRVSEALRAEPAAAQTDQEGDGGVVDASKPKTTTELEYEGW